MDSLLDVNGTRLFVDQRGPDDGHPLLFIHGGPGNPSWDFMASVGDRFAERGIRIIGVDQRGVLRSDPVPSEAPLTIRLLIDDVEEIRRQLGIDRWTVIGHSAGGAYALDYALAHPERIDALILDCPALDTDATDRHRLPRAAAMLDEAGETEAAAACRRFATLGRRITADDRTWESMQPLGARYLDLFLYDGQTRARYEQVVGSAPAGLDWSRGVSHLRLLGELYCDRRPELSALTVPSMIVRGEADMVAPPVVLEDYRAATGGEVVSIPQAGHFAFVEQPDAYVDQVLRFMSAR
ncbi:alpha/beta fold hydrolase [Microbacterium sp. NPDC058342]|uniref:alpha/beta fold hydrolase n=1 Tax=Microbacterium sp. NPDC058342 TaxID=3346454 RepID=UPI003659181E